MAITTGRIKTFAPGDITTAAHLNAIQDRVSDNDQDILTQLDDTASDLSADMARNKHDELIRHIPPIPHPGRVNCQFTIDGWLECTADGGDALVSLPVTEGDRLLDVWYRCYGQQDGFTRCRLYKSTNEGGVMLAEGTAYGPLSSWGDGVLTIGSPEVVGSDAHYHVHLLMTRAGQRVRDIRVRYDRP